MSRVKENKMAKHTPTPRSWIASFNGLRWDICDGNLHQLGMAYTEKDAAKIVQEHNAHDALVEALRGLIVAYEQEDRDSVCVMDAENAARAALKLAEGGGK